jgi:hypothetical protein
MTFENFLRRRRGVRDCPTVYGCLGDYSDNSVRDPLPKRYILVVGMRFDFLFCVDIENLKRPTGYGRIQISGEWSEKGRVNLPLSARIFARGLTIALSAVIGLRKTLLASARSMMTTWFCSPTFSLTQMKWSDSRVNV